MANLLNVVLPTFIVILIGYLWGRLKKQDISSIVELVFWIGLPALAFTSVIDKKIVLLDASKVWASALLVIFGAGIIAWIVFKILRQKHSGLYMSIISPNAVNIPFPIISLAYGPAGLAAATLFYIPASLVLYTVDTYIASGQRHWKDSLKEMLRVPALYAAVAGLAVNFGNIAVPDLVVKPLSFIAQAVTPLVLLIAGYNLSRVRMKSLPTPLLASFLRVGVGLGLGFLAVSLFHLTGILRAVVILDSAMPAAVNTSMLATKYKNEAELVSSVVFITTIASLVIIPLLLHFLGN